MSAGSILTERRSERSMISQPLSWNTIQTARNASANEAPSIGSDRSRHLKRSDRTTDAGASKSPGSGSNQMSAEERLDELLALHAQREQHRRRNTPRGGDQAIGGNLVGSPLESPASPVIDHSRRSPQREFTTPRATRERTSIIDVNAHEAGVALHDVSEEAIRESDLNQEVVALTQRQLTSEFEVAEMNSLREESEVHRRILEQELSQEIHMFNQAQGLIQKMRRNFSIEDDGCIRRIEMLERQRNEYEEGMYSMSQQAELIMNERNVEYNSEISRIRSLAESHVGRQSEDIAQLRHELQVANMESNRNSRMESEFQRESLSRNEHLSSELLTAKSQSLHQENELSSMRQLMNDRSAILLSEISNMKSTIQQQSELQLQKTGFTEEEIKMYIMKKISKVEEESKQETMMLKAMLQSENEVARLHEDRFNMITSRSSEGNPLASEIIESLMDRLYREQQDTERVRRTRDEHYQQILQLEPALIREEHELERTEDRMKRLWNDLEKEQSKNAGRTEYKEGSLASLKSKDEVIEFLESEASRLRDGRNEEIEYNQQLWEEIGEMDEHYKRHDGGGSHGEAGEASSKDHEESKPRISRREADKIAVPSWPKSHDLDGWKSQLLSNVLSACADSDQDAWINWLGEAYKILPDIDGMGDSGGSRFATMDVKLANALNAMINTSGDSGREVGVEIKVKTLDLARCTPPKVMKGRQIVAMILESFRSSTQTDLTFTGKHLYEMAYPGDTKLNLFRNQWIHVLSAMREDDKPRDLALRDMLFDKIKGSTLMQFDIRYYKSLREGHADKTYDYLMEMMSRTIATEREEKNRLDKAKGIRELLGAKALAAEKPDKGSGKTKNDTSKDNAENSAVPVLTKPSPKAHGEKGKGKGGNGKGKGPPKGDRSRGRTPSQDKKKIPCVFHFQKGGCSRGKDCLFSHAKKHAPRGSSPGPGKGKGGGGQGKGRSSSPKATPKGEKPCFLFAKGKCDRADCPYKHDSEAAPAETESAKAKAAPKGKAKAAAAKAKAAVVVEVKNGNSEGFLPDWSDSEDSSPVAASKYLVTRTRGHVRKDKVVKIRRNPEKIYYISKLVRTPGVFLRKLAREPLIPGLLRASF